MGCQSYKAAIAGDWKANTFTNVLSDFFWKWTTLLLQQLDVSAFMPQQPLSLAASGFIETDATVPPQKCTLNANPVLESNNRKTSSKDVICFNFMAQN